MNLELFLNLLWLALAVGGFAAVLPRAVAPRPDGSSRREAGHAALAILCALAILFPIVSVTDDLHADLQAVEEWSGSRRAQWATVLHHLDSPQGNADGLSIILALLVALMALLLTTESIEAADVPQRRAQLLVPARSHAPPFRS